MVISRKGSKTDDTPTALFEDNNMEEIKATSVAEGVEGEENSVTRLAQQRGFDKCPICLTLVIADSVVTECAHKFCAPCLTTLSAQSFTFTCPSCRTQCLTVKTIRAKKIYREIKQFTCPAPECPPEVVMTLDEFEQHIRKECPSRLIKCDCGSLVKGSLYADHQLSAHPKTRCNACNEDVFTGLVHLCPKDEIDCVQCCETVSRQSLAEHMEACPQRKIKCKTCGLPGPQNVIRPHQSACVIESCRFCGRRFRSDKLLQHFCHSAPVACPIFGCTFQSHYQMIGHHLASHPELYDTGIFSETTPTLYVITDEEPSDDVWFGQKLEDYGSTIMVRVFGQLPLSRDIVIAKTSPRLSLLETDPLNFSSGTLNRLFSDISPLNICSLFTQGLFTHKESEIVAHLERQYKSTVVGEVSLFASQARGSFPPPSIDPILFSEYA